MFSAPTSSRWAHDQVLCTMSPRWSSQPYQRTCQPVRSLMPSVTEMIDRTDADGPWMHRSRGHRVGHHLLPSARVSTAVGQALHRAFASMPVSTWGPSNGVGRRMRDQLGTCSPPRSVGRQEPGDRQISAPTRAGGSTRGGGRVAPDARLRFVSRSRPGADSSMWSGSSSGRLGGSVRTGSCAPAATSG